jgi:type II secretory pathway pseudopilin PulG
MFPSHKKNLNGGFTLIELIVSVGLFTAAFVAISGSFLSIVDAYRKVTSERTNMDNLSTAVESMVRGMNTGTTYHCGAGGDIGTPQDCGAGDTYLAFEKADGDPGTNADQIVYKFVACPNADPYCGRLERSDNGGANFFPVTDVPSVSNISYLKFYVIGNTPLDLSDPAGDVVQPKVVIIMKGTAGLGIRRSSSFSLQTTITQRRPDVL